MDSFVIDTNIVFSALLKESAPRKIILSEMFNLFAPEFLFTEIQKYEKMILEKSRMTKERFGLLLLLLQSHIAVIPFQKFSGFLKVAEDEMRGIDLKDSLFLALALKLKIPIWSNDLHFKKQSIVESYTTDEIVTYFIKGYSPSTFF